MRHDMEAAGRYRAIMPGIRKLIDQIPKDEMLTCFGKKRPLAEDLHRMEAEIQRILSENHQVSMVMVNLPAQSGVAFRSDVPMCAQSTVKAIYVGAMLTFFPQAMEEHRPLIRDAIVLSSNEAYEKLRQMYGKEPIRAWCLETGVEESFADTPYPRAFHARDMLKLWTRLYCFLNSGASPECVRQYFTESALSAAKERLREKCPLHTKAGWENGLEEGSRDYRLGAIPPRFLDGDPLNDECATNDSGIIYSDWGPYLFVIYSDFPWPWFGENRLYELTDALYALRFEQDRSRDQENAEEAPLE